MNYNQQITLLIKSDSLKNAWSITFNEDFTASQLEFFSFSTVNKSGTVVYNYIDNNLNNVSTTQKDTIIDNISITKISFSRVRFYSYTFPQLTDANKMYNYMMIAKEPVGFSVFISYADKNSTTYSIQSTIKYIPGPYSPIS
jgi:hypothetical protein